MKQALRSTLALARVSWLEAIRNRILMVTLMFAVVLVGLSVAAASVTIYEQARLILDVGLAAVSGLGSIMAVTLTISSFARELTQHTAYPVLARPVPRWTFVLGKYLGILAAMLLVVTLMALATAAVVRLYGSQVPTAFWGALLLGYAEIAVVVAVALLFSTLAVPALAAAYTAGLLLAGNLSAEIGLAAARQDDAVTGAVLRAVHHVLPNLDKLSARVQAANNLAVPAAYLGYGTLYGLTYAGLALLVAMAVFQRRRTL